MCQDCGCEEGNKIFFNQRPNGENLPKLKTIQLAHNILNKNDEIAKKNRTLFNKRNQLAINIMSSPGSGKTTLLEKTIPLISMDMKVDVIVGDQATQRDAQRLKNAGARVEQIITNGSCHLDALMVEKEIEQFIRSDSKIVFIENVGNLVCPSAFDLGETKRVAILSLPEGEDKPIKYPALFHKADLVILSKMDLGPYLEFQVEACIEFIKMVNPHCKIIKLSSKTSQGLDEWVDILKEWQCA